MDQSKESQKLFFNRKAEEREFKLLALVEDTILGILEIIERVFRTLIIILFKPKKLRASMALPCHETVLIGPFTFLTFSSFISSLIFGVDILNVSGFSTEIANELSQLSIASVIILAFPLLLTKTLLALVLTSLISVGKGAEYRSTTFKLVCYWFGMMFLVFGLTAFLFLVVIWRIEEVSLWTSIGVLIAAIMIFLYASICIGIQIFERFRLIKVKILELVFRALISMVISVLVFVTAIFVGLEIDRLVEWSLESSGELHSKLSVYTSEMEMTESGKTKVMILVKNDSDNLTYIKRNYKILILELSYQKCDGVKSCESLKNEAHQYFISDWEGGSDNLMSIAGGETKWIEISLDLGDVNTKREELDFSRISIKTLGLKTLVPQPYNMREDGTIQPRSFEKSTTALINSIIWGD